MKKVLQQSSASLDRLLQHSRYLEYLSKRLLTYLPAEFAEKVTVLGFSNKKNSNNDNQQALIVAAISPAWASKLRFYTPTLKRSLCAEPQFNQLKKIVIRVAASKASVKKDNESPLYSQNSAAIIQNSAEHIENNELKEALIRLARNVENGG
ncbi:MAG: DUF721 domain-containing protein [gamma proteobacterium symbiont of Bathyaustriella thionipta]|nr:DUF721 domain-containing protein [gamma proteobacterium symbiont of Bathyaustriella thionipta]MCU7950187.1 DUF721 domain-containing protein [gamma proteobacterium symbiont of Bathyaustriella thionipta]MCU7953897.1 DUF721 domain-containing protein [gamma proteobacterium symbiont of Bathyaustriella thionipta]MCU7955007.1 DUF721 domain-containing protein [gamma proteobacterium symbiont of Bathyaustriella thionipta]MCU7966861.1 DUF721 domain-containing protein [gamma proteobacterium symbiont of 